MQSFKSSTIIVNNLKSTTDNELDLSENMLREWFAREPKATESSECRCFIERLDGLSTKQRQDIFDRASGLLALNILGDIP